MRTNPWTFALTFLAGSMFLPGCAEQPAPGPQERLAVETSAGPAGSEENEIRQALAELSAEDRALAEKQKVCPVSDEPLGSMGKPCKVNVGGRDVLLCCDGCEEEIKAHPDKYLAKLPQ